MARFSLSTELSKKIEKCHAEREMSDKKLGKLCFDCLVILVYLLLAEADVDDRRPGHCGVSSLALPQTHHVSVTKFHIYWAVIMFTRFTVGLRVCNSEDCPCSYKDISCLLVHKCPQWKAAALWPYNRWAWVNHVFIGVHLLGVQQQERCWVLFLDL